MPEKLLREIRKLEVRLEGFLKREEVFVKGLKKCLDKFRELNDLERLKTGTDPEEIEELMNLRLEAVKALSEALKKASQAEHEKSHLLESYGDLVLALEEEFKDLLSRS
ncbi:MAG: hypothetical protein NWE87_04610 [Candidatus Bathyarchaeota archaeon]|nr:hypothetical protein [Candidatus Bathyarchaeota archaeon]